MKEWYLQGRMGLAHLQRTEQLKKKKFSIKRFIQVGSSTKAGGVQEHPVSN